MDGFVAAIVVAVRVNLQVQRKTLDALLRREICAQTVDGDEDLWGEKIKRENRTTETKKMEELVFKAKRKFLIFYSDFLTFKILF